MRGLTTAGFVPKTQAEVRASIEVALKARFIHDVESGAVKTFGA